MKYCGKDGKYHSWFGYMLTKLDWLCMLCDERTAIARNKIHFSPDECISMAIDTIEEPDEEFNEELNDPEESNIVEFILPANMEAVNLEIQTSLDKLEEEAKQLKDTQQAHLNTIAKSTLSQRFSSILSELF